jgi:hypothetical protein
VREDSDVSADGRMLILDFKIAFLTDLLNEFDSQRLRVLVPASRFTSYVKPSDVAETVGSMRLQ